ncbi:hypothetical protein [Cryptosporangium aurantiacum]|uniref:Uncharacterized protein n=1 Tax=Cryptosporangium aurantiacum TaxID=134849 RepID=A0A1M7R1W4_9ACTN|nr:hypothetical protein [Cryptosporangium aurantiacum]SHN38690.1 hypothetical protein SAMN05443668_106119 [Cryptosporangium aurantiacum]
MDALLNSLTETELLLARETEPERLTSLDEDALVELHTRVRRARNKQVKLYRRQAAARVEDIGGRGKAYPKNTRSRAKAEVFEEALARVSERLAAVARESAATLRAERLAEAERQGNPVPPGPPEAPAARRRASQRLDRTPDHAGIPKQRASTRASGARRQARRDNR